eukprot:scaffold2224_cov261-Pinguiococcus_pyrenoidosus.AAC.27
MAYVLLAWRAFWAILPVGGRSLTHSFKATFATFTTCTLRTASQRGSPPRPTRLRISQSGSHASAPGEQSLGRGHSCVWKEVEEPPNNLDGGRDQGGGDQDEERRGGPALGIAYRLGSWQLLHVASRGDHVRAAARPQGELLLMALELALHPLLLARTSLAVAAKVLHQQLPHGAGAVLLAGGEVVRVREAEKHEVSVQRMVEHVAVAGVLIFVVGDDFLYG